MYATGGKRAPEFCIKWEREDQKLSGSKITHRGLVGTLNGVEEFLDCTIETGEDFEDMWLWAQIFVSYKNKG